jgi:hypothetical protein
MNMILNGKKTQRQQTADTGSGGTEVKNLKVEQSK